MRVTTKLSRPVPWVQPSTTEAPQPSHAHSWGPRANVYVYRNASDASTDALRRNASADPSPASLSTKVGREESESNTLTPMTKTFTRTRRTTAGQRETLGTTLLLRLALSLQLAVASRGHLLGSMPTT